MVLPDKYKSEKLVTSYLGYFSDTLLIKNVKRRINILMTSNIEVLPSATVKPPDIADILTKMVFNMKDNYWDKPINVEGFYRQILYENDTAKRIAEVACSYYLDAYRKPYIAGQASNVIMPMKTLKPHTILDCPLYDLKDIRPLTCQVKINELQLRRTNQSTSVNFYIAFGPLGFFARDMLNYSYYRIFAKKNNFRKTYKSILKTIEKSKVKTKIDYIQIDGKPLYLIQIHGSESWLLELYINKENYAVIKYNYCHGSVWNRNVYHKPLSSFTHKMDEKYRHDTLFTDSSFTSIEYMLFKGRYYVSSIKNHTTFKYKYDSGEKTKLKIYREYMTNSIQTENVSNFPQDSCYPNFYRTDIFNYPKAYNPEFWETYNSLMPTEEQINIKNSLNLYDPIEKEYIFEEK